ncbi:MAG: hypothetical protein HQL84_00355 [Magnetococcales bacterium]|nr:hypothetical protein [Magnetococcales bacterium]MBF0148479.1 hypothetical protein [Magnetococcales bacterium]MBF0629923.1 hypothetical protein [Magnetococcales bacterium]
MVDQIAWLTILLPWGTALFLAGSRILHPHWHESREKRVARISLAASLIPVGLLLLLDLKALIQGVPGAIGLGEWFGAGAYRVQLELMLDGLSLTIATLMGWISFLTIRFSVLYMHREGGFMRFFMILHLFSGAMQLIVQAGNAVLTFVGWELAGVSSFLLIGYAFERHAATRNANRAFITNRFGDAGFMFGIFAAFTWFGGIDWSHISTSADQVETLGATLVGVGFMTAAMAKSAQIPFSPWIARAMDGPTPSSAIFYGALMVHAGIYLTLRLEPMLLQTPSVLTSIAVLGLLTALYGWMIALAQSDVKSSLIFSTISQIGLMFFWCGLGWFTLAAWHMGLHIAFRAWQFLHAPSLMDDLDRPAPPAPQFLTRWPQLHSAVIQRFWLEHLGDAMMAAPTYRLAADMQVFEHRVITPLTGLPAHANAISTLAQWQDQQSGVIDSAGYSVERSTGIAGRTLQKLASILHHFEENMILKGGGAGLFQTLLRIGKRLTQIDLLLSQPRYLFFMIALTFVIIL